MVPLVVDTEKTPAGSNRRIKEGSIQSRRRRGRGEEGQEKRRRNEKGELDKLKGRIA